MKTVIKVLLGFFLGFGLIQLVDLGFYLMNRPDSYLFNLGVLMLAAIGVVVAFLLLYIARIIKPDVKEEINQNKKEKLN
jgi:ABC-type antimicrobial peptide transport system permease subunit